MTIVVPSGKPLDVLRLEAGRSVHKSKCHKQKITGDQLLSATDHAVLAEGCTRQWAADRKGDVLLGHCTHFPEDKLIAFEYHNPRTATFLARNFSEWEDTGVDVVYHGGYWETGIGVMLSGEIHASTDDKEIGEHEYHKTQGCYTSPNPEVACKHYAWASNRFENNCYYGLSFKCLGKKTSDRIVGSGTRSEIP